jgi:hypothetical protein
MAMQEFRPMGVGDILDTTFRLYRQRFLTFLLIAAIVYVPYALLMSVFQAVQMHQIQTAHQAGLDPTVAIMGIIGGMLVVLLFTFILMPLCTAALVHNISGSYLGEELTAGQSYARATRRLPALLGTQILVGLTVMVGFFLLIVPGIIFSLWFLVVVPVVMLEGKSGSTAMGRSRELMRGNLDKGFILAVVVFILGAILQWALAFLAAIVPLPHPAVGVFIQTALLSIVLPIQTAPWTLLYYDLRIRKEAFDLEKLAEALAPTTAA